jgi:uncharacterized protein YfaS (alpha-2-macroglobulin family)
MKIKVEYLTTDGDGLNVKKLEQGTDFVAEIKVKNISRHEMYREVALTQLVPSGWEIHNQRLTQGEDDDKGVTFRFQDIRDDRVYTYFDLKPRQSITFRVHLTAASEVLFYLPVVAAEAMYDAAINARVPGRWVEVVRADASD